MPMYRPSSMTRQVDTIRNRASADPIIVFNEPDGMAGICHRRRLCLPLRKGTRFQLADRRH